MSSLQEELVSALSGNISVIYSKLTKISNVVSYLKECFTALVAYLCAKIDISQL